MPEPLQAAPPEFQFKKFNHCAEREAATRNLKPETVLAFDFGEKRVGVAVGDRALGIPHPLTAITAVDSKRRFAAIAALIDEWRPARLVVGLPRHADGGEHALTRRCRRFAHQLHGRFGLPVELIDERLTSATAATLLGEAGVAAHRRQAALDPVAAQQILQGYFDAARGQT